MATPTDDELAEMSKAWEVSIDRLRFLATCPHYDSKPHIRVDDYKDPADRNIAKAIRAVHDGGSPLDPKAARALLESRRSRNAGPQLTDREREVLLLVRDGLANKQIARRLGIAERTVKAHLTSVFQRLGVTDRTQAALWASEHLEPAD